MGDKEGLANRVNDLLINPEAIENIEVHGNDMHWVVSNTPQSAKSIQIYAAITSNRGWITPESAARGLEIYGQELVDEARALRERGSDKRHFNIDFLETIASQTKPLRSEIYTRESAKPYPLSNPEIKAAVEEFATPFILYSEFGIESRARKLNRAFSWVPGGFKNHFAIKANDNNYIADLVRNEGQGLDCSSSKELRQAKELGFKDEDIMFTANDVSIGDFVRARDLCAIINFDDITHIPFFQSYVGDLPRLACCRFNPGDERVGNSIIGNPTEAKYGMTRTQIFEAFKMLKKGGVERFGIHTMVASNERNPEYFVETGRMMFSLAAELKKELRIEVEFVNLGGGIGTAYRPEHKEVDLDAVSNGIKTEYEKMVALGGIRPDLRILMENGRWVTGPEGILVSRVLHIAQKHKTFVGLDSSMASLPRPAIYDAYHHVTLLGREHEIGKKRYDVSGSLCENNDKFAVDRLLPEVNFEDVAIIHNAGAHCYVMGSNYNGKEQCAEVLVHKDRTSLELIRRAKSYEDMMITQRFKGSKFLN